MVRRFPRDENRLINPAISLSLFAVGMAAAIAMITTLCGVWFRRRTPASGPSSPTAGGDNKQEEKERKEEDRVKEPALPLPPKMQQVAGGSSPAPSGMLKSASERKMSQLKSLSIKVPRSLSVVKSHLEEGRQKRKEKMKVEESIWTKTIILGEKCRVSEEEDDGVIYQGKGKKISAYHPRPPTSMSISRQSSAIDAQALPKLQPQ